MFWIWVVKFIVVLLIELGYFEEGVYLKEGIDIRVKFEMYIRYLSGNVEKGI